MTNFKLRQPGQNHQLASFPVTIGLSLIRPAEMFTVCYSLHLDTHNFSSQSFLSLHHQITFVQYQITTVQIEHLTLNIVRSSRTSSSFLQHLREHRPTLAYSLDHSKCPITPEPTELTQD